MVLPFVMITFGAPHIYPSNPASILYLTSHPTYKHLAIRPTMFCIVCYVVFHTHLPNFIDINSLSRMIPGVEIFTIYYNRTLWSGGEANVRYLSDECIHNEVISHPTNRQYRMLGQGLRSRVCQGPNHHHLKPAFRFPPLSTWGEIDCLWVEALQMLEYYWTLNHNI